MEPVSLTSAQLYEEIERYGPKVKDKLIKNPNDFIGDSIRRPSFTENYSWAIPSPEAIQEIAIFIGSELCLEVGAGKGLWAYLLKAAGVNIIATDPRHEPEPWLKDIDNPKGLQGKYGSVGPQGPMDPNPSEKISVRCVDFDLSDFYRQIGVNVKELKILDRFYLPIEKLDYKEALLKYKEASCLFLCWGRIWPYDEFTGNKIIFIGEEEGGCTTPPPDPEKWELVKEITIPQWSGIYDFLGLYQRKSV